MPDYSIEINTDTGDREAGLQDALARHNAAVAQRNAALPEGEEQEPTLDGKQYLQSQADVLVDDYAAQYVATAAQQVNEKFERADQATRDQVVTLLAVFQPASLKVA